ncbi:hypothetical protein G7Y89_g11195 [Cudoniella acicularis]|uniref:Uncharacterized protein n=1 Tax=Cudoniella acicularis TaxID=354080 RepID=A0A8H4RE39_9HELO|nr:hypothetical protein G7Y89_g11195 [Cudoniella acicularis]
MPLRPVEFKEKREMVNEFLTNEAETGKTNGVKNGAGKGNVEELDLKLPKWKDLPLVEGMPGLPSLYTSLKVSLNASRVNLILDLDKVYESITDYTNRDKRSKKTYPNKREVAVTKRLNLSPEEKERRLKN